MALAEYLAVCDSEFNPSTQMIQRPSRGPGYHTRLVAGTPAHATRDAMDYALALLQSGEAARAQRACDVVEKIASLQTTDPTDSHYGIWGWFLEEPAKQMDPADWNWADFIGARLAQIIVVHAAQVRPDTLSAARNALMHAALAIHRRNVTATYTNIAIMGGVVTAAAGEILDMPFLVEYGRLRLNNVIQLVEDAGGFPEFNSPTYTRVGIEEAERALLIVKDDAVRQLAERIRVLAWEAFAEHFHPATGQIAGPCSRAYSDWLMPGLNRYFHEQTGAEIPLREETTEAGVPMRSNVAKAANTGCDLVPPLPCPEHLRRRFAALPEVPHVITRRFSKHASGDVIGTTWFQEEACLGTVNRDTMWTQRRPLLAYWRTAKDVAVCLRARLLSDGRDFSPSYTYQAQQGARVLSSYCLAYEAGAFHPVFHKPAGDVYEMSDLRLRIGLAGGGVEVSELGEGRFALAAGEWRAVIHTGEACHMDGRPIAWRMVRGTGGFAALEAVLHEGETLRLDGRNTPLKLAFALELLHAGEKPASERPAADAEGGLWRWNWSGLQVASPAAPVRFCW